MTPDDVGKLSIPIIEKLFEAFGKANEDQENQSESKDTLTNADALGFLMNNPM